MSRFRVYLILAAGLVLHLTILDHFRIFGAKPDIMLIPVIFFGLFLGRRVGFESGLVAGLAKDLFAFDFFGINTSIFALTGYLAGVMGANLSRDSKKAQALSTVLFTVTTMTMHFIMVSIFLGRINLNFGEYLAASIIPSSVYTAALSIPIFAKLEQVFDIRSSEDYL